MSTQDPAAFFRAMIGEWTNNAKGQDGGGGLRAMMDQAMSAANLPTRAEVDALHARLDRVEAALFRIEAQFSAAKPKKKAKD